MRRIPAGTSTRMTMFVPLRSACVIAGLWAMRGGASSNETRIANENKGKEYVFIATTPFLSRTGRMLTSSHRKVQVGFWRDGNDQELGSLLPLIYARDTVGNVCQHFPGNRAAPVRDFGDFNDVGALWA